MSNYPKNVPPQSQNDQPGIENEMSPKPIYIRENYRGSGKLSGKKALITGGDSGIGRAVAVHFAAEGADVAIIHTPEENQDAAETIRLVEQYGQKAISIPGDLASFEFCTEAVRQTVDALGGINILVNNAAVQFPQESVTDIEPEQLERTFRVNIFSFFYMAKLVVPYLKEGDTIINTTSVLAYEGNEMMIDYSSTKGAILSFTRALSQNLLDKKIRVNAVAPGPIWTPLIPATFSAEKVAAFGRTYPMKRPGQPAEVAPSYVFLASEDSTFMAGQVLHPNGGKVIGA